MALNVTGALRKALSHLEREKGGIDRQIRVVQSALAALAGRKIPAPTGLRSRSTPLAFSPHGRHHAKCDGTARPGADREDLPTGRTTRLGLVYIISRGQCEVQGSSARAFRSGGLGHGGKRDLKRGLRVGRSLTFQRPAEAGQGGNKRCEQGVSLQSF